MSVVNNDAEKLAQSILNNEIILIKTDTIYGLLGNANNMCVEKIKKIKNRTNNCFGLFFESIEMIKIYAECSVEQEVILNKYLPGFFTFILSISNNMLNYLPLDILVYNEQIKKYTIGCRIPNFTLCREIVNNINAPIIATSANISNNKTPLVFSDIDNQILQNVDYIFRYPEEDINQNLESTIVDIIDINNIKIIRQGSGEFS